MADPRAQDCDLIMKGGVTSGLVYPGAIAELAKTYRLRSIGGTSAGAIGAVAAAAMEYGLRTGRNPNARDAMAALAGQLSQQTDGGSSRLNAMFSGDAGTARLLGAIKAMLGGDSGPLKRLGFGLLPLGLLLGIAALAAGIAVGAAALAEGRSGAVQGLISVGSFLGATAILLALGFGTLGRQLRQRVEALLGPIVGNGFGLASGLAPTGETLGGQPVPALNAWLHGIIQSLAGHAADTAAEVLTFGHLWTLGQPDAADARNPREIDLVLVCSDLNRLQSAAFPFLPDNQRLFYDPAAWAKIFPDVVLAALARHGPPATGPLPPDLGYSEADVARALADLDTALPALRLLPRPGNLPILIGARASMAFPGLFTPLPLWLLRWVGQPEVAEERRPVLSRVYLSDGGITSNFPIHLFDAAVPGRPTFAINLLYPDDDLSIEEFDGGDAAALAGKRLPANVRTIGGSRHDDGALLDHIMPFTNSDRVAFYKAPAPGDALAQLIGFGARVVETARTWGDVGLYNQVGMRDRIIHVRLSGEEGGFNLAMSQSTIRALDGKGRFAGEVLGGRFDRTAPTDPLGSNPVELSWTNHVRIRAENCLLAQDLLAGRFAGNWAGAAPLVRDPHLLAVAGGVTGIAALPRPTPDPLDTALRPLSLLRLRPAGDDPRMPRR
ncbi:MAG: hypothetical protein WCO11_00635 [Sphingomonadales bacterium]|jgi:hypothetical protein